MAEVINFNMVVDINKILKENHIDYTIHALGGCTCAGLKLRQEGEPHDINDIIEIINNYIANKWMKAILDDNDHTIIHVHSKFNCYK